MSFCSKCGTQMNDDAKFCSNCGTAVNEAPVQQPVYSTPSNPQDSGSFGWAVLCFFFPIVGLILFLVWKDEKPKSAKMAGIGALVSVALSIVGYILIFAVSCGTAMMYY